MTDDRRPTGLVGLLSTLLEKKPRHLLVQVFRYTAASVISLAIDFSILVFLTEAVGLHYLVSAPIGYAAGMVAAYLLSILWVFDRRRLERRRAAEFAIFVAVGLLGMGLNELLLWFFTEVVLLYYMYSRGISAVIGYLWKFLARKLLLFR